MMVHPFKIQRIIRVLAYLTAGAALLALLAAAWFQAIYPDWGFTYSRYTGKIFSVNTEGPASGKIPPGAHLYYLNGIAVETFRYPLQLAQGEAIRVVFTAGSGLEATRIDLATPSFWVIGNRMSPLLAALSISLIGVIVFARSELGRLPPLFMLACQATALSAGLSSLSVYQIAYVYPASQIVSWWVGPLFLHVFLILLFPTRSVATYISIILYILALAFSVVSGVGLELFVVPANAPLARNVWATIHLMAAATLAILGYATRTSMNQRRTAGLLILSSLGGTLPITLLSLLPEALTGNTLVQYPLTMWALPLLPLGIGYAIFYTRLVPWETTINRSAAYALAALAVASIYLGVFLSLPELLPGKDRQISALGLLAVAGLAFAARPLYELCRRGVTKLIYGGWYDERGAVKQISQALSRSEGDVGEVAETLCQALVRTMQLAYAHLLLVDGRIIVQERNRTAPDCHTLAAVTAQHLMATFAEAEKGEGILPPEKGGELPLSTKEKALVFGRKPQMELLLAGRSSPLGLLVLGPRVGGEFEPQDLEIIEVVVRQAKAALENAYLLKEVRQSSEHINRLHRQLLEAREEERKRVARDLHDQTIQALAGLNYQIARIKKRQNPELWDELNLLQNKVQQILREVRQICADLRPPGLDDMGLASAIRSRLAVFRSHSSLQIELAVEDGLDPREEISLTLYRCFQEALMNVQKHAQASRVSIDLKKDQGDIMLIIEDDGQGFILPEKLEDFTEVQHFGLVGLIEQIEATGGRLEIHTAPGEGCRLTARVPCSSTGVKELL